MLTISSLLICQHRTNLTFIDLVKCYISFFICLFIYLLWCYTLFQKAKNNKLVRTVKFDRSLCRKMTGHHRIFMTNPNLWHLHIYFFHFINMGSSFPQERTLHMVDPSLQIYFFHFTSICASFPIGNSIRTQSLWPIQVSKSLFPFYQYLSIFNLGECIQTQSLWLFQTSKYIFSTSSIFVHPFLIRSKIPT